MCLGTILLGLAFIFLGPSPLLNIGPPRLWITIVFSFPMGIGVAFVLVPATNDVMREAKLVGMPVCLCLFFDFLDQTTVVNWKKVWRICGSYQCAS